MAWFGGRLATGLVDVTDDLTALDSAGWWAVVVTFEGHVTCARFADVRDAALPAACWPGVPTSAWSSSMSRAEYVEKVGLVRAGIAAGDHYQVNLCRVLSAPLPPSADLVGLAGLLAQGNPSPYAGMVRLPSAGVEVVTASPELFLLRTGDVVESGPIKGTAPTAAGLTDKDRAENVMIVDLVRNDLGAVAVTGSVEVPALNAVEEHPGLVHLVSTVHRAGTSIEPHSQTRPRSLRTRSTIITFSARSLGRSSDSVGAVPLIGREEIRSPRRPRNSSGEAEATCRPC